MPAAQLLRRSRHALRSMNLQGPDVSEKVSVSLKILTNPVYRWSEMTVGDYTVHYQGDRAPVELAVESFASHGREGLCWSLHDAIGHFAAMVKGPGGGFAFVDHCRSIPIFFHEDCVSNCAEKLRRHFDIATPDKVSVLEAAMAGFVTGPYTLFEDLRQLQGGEILFREEEGVTTRRYYTYCPEELAPGSVAYFAEALGPVMDRVIGRVIDAAKGKPVWVPLSGGLDSRIILCKLKELGCPNLRSFSYGPTGNDEIRIARKVAKTLDVPWVALPSRRRDMKAYFNSQERADYWQYSSGCTSVPNLQDILPIRQLLACGEMQQGDFVVNGQTGDFITGGHIPKGLLAQGAGIDDLVGAIEGKHFSLWSSLKTRENMAAIGARIFENLDITGDETLSPQELAALYERHEYQERQGKYIINGQRIYDYYGLNWRLPLWDQEFIRFWQNVPAEIKSGQKVYRKFLDDYDYKGLFRGYSPVISQWPGALKLFLVLFRIVRLTCGRKMRDKLLKRVLYFGLYRHLYAPYSYKSFLRHADNLRNPVSLFALTWLEENGIRMPDAG